MKGVIFDFNGTLFFDNPKHVMAWSKISEMIRGRGISSEELHTKCNGVTNKKIIEYLFNGSHGCVNVPADKAAKLYSLIELGTPIYIRK